MTVRNYFTATIILSLTLVGAGSSPILAQANFIGLGLPPDAIHSYGNAISADGSVVTGYFVTDSVYAFRWTAAAGMQNLGTIPDGYSSQAWGISADGSAACGNALGPGGNVAFRWTTSNGMQNLGHLPGATYTDGRAISSDGLVVTGISASGPPFGRAFRWSAATGMQDLGLLPGGSLSGGEGINADGSVIVGAAQISGNRTRPFRWTAATGMKNMGLLTGHTDGWATAVSADGMTVTGAMVNDSTSHAFRWTSAGGFQNLAGPSSDFPWARGSDISADGAVVVGEGRAADGLSRAILWSEATGMVDLKVHLSSLGVDLTGWTLDAANGISADGRTIVGYGIHDGHTEAWIAHLAACAPCDVNCDGSTNQFDIQPFVTSLITGEHSCSPCAGDTDGDGSISQFDIQGFIECLGG